MNDDERKNGMITRREFLRASSTIALAAAGAAAVSQSSSFTSSSLSAKPQTKIKAPIRLGIAGGNFGAQFYWHEHPQCKVVAVADLIPARRKYMQETYRCDQAYSSLEEMIDKADLDAVAVFTGATDTVNHNILCLEKGLHVVGASPAAMNLTDARRLRDAVRKSGLVYMMGETSYFYQPVISARKWYHDGQFGEVFCCEAEYHHPGLEKLFVDENGQRTWRYGLPPMLYSTHCTGQLIGVTNEKLTRVSCQGYGDDSLILQDNPFKNPFWNETALFKTSKGNTLRAAVYWRGAMGISERASWMGERMSFYPPTPNCNESVIRRTKAAVAAAAAAGKRVAPFEKYDQKLWWQTDMLPEPLRHISGHDGSHTFLTHAFISALVDGTPPPMGVELALDMAIPGIIAHESALQSGKSLTIPSAADL